MLSLRQARAFLLESLFLFEFAVVFILIEVRTAEDMTVALAHLGYLSLHLLTGTDRT